MFACLPSAARSINFVFFCLWVVVEAVLFALTFLEYAHAREFSIARQVLGKVGLSVGRASARVISLNCSIILIPTCRAIGAFVSRRFPRYFSLLPAGKVVHWFIGRNLVAFSLVHIAAHISNFVHLSKRILPARSVYQVLLGGGTGLTGLALVMMLFFLVANSSLEVRRVHFELFQWSHWLWLPFLLVGSFHGAFCELKRNNAPHCLFPKFFLWWMPAAIVFWANERLLRWRNIQRGAVIKRAILHPSCVLELQFQMPADWTCKPGQFIYLKIPQISPWQWHPFSITSGQSTECSLHIRLSSGDWCNALGELFGVEPNTLLVNVPHVFPIAFVEGPYGSFFEAVETFPVLVLFAAGIGQTPFASLLKRIKACSDAELRTCWKRVHFFVVGREPAAFEWFYTELKAFDQREDLFSIRLLLTGSPSGKEEVHSISINDFEGSCDAITGLKTATRYGKPNLECLVADLAAIHSGTKIGVYFCGPEGLNERIERAVKRHGNMRYFSECF